MCCMRSSLLKAQIVMFVFQVYDYVDLTFSYLQVYPALCTVELEGAEMKSMGTSNPGFAIAVFTMQLLVGLCILGNESHCF